MNLPMNLRKIFLDAAYHIERVGWCQKVDEDDQGRVCIHKAIRIVASDQVERLKATRRFTKLVGTHALSFNDTPGRTMEQVTAALRACARQL
jgi:hypothetical protein